VDGGSISLWPSLTAPLLSVGPNKHSTPIGPAVGHLQHGTLFLGLRHLASQSRCHSTLTWTPSHPERTKPQHAWTADEWGIRHEDHMWTDSETGGDIWNRRWTQDLLSSLLGEAAQHSVDQRFIKRALQRLKKLAQLLQTAQRAI
jgi:hypothetical protein